MLATALLATLLLQQPATRVPGSLGAVSSPAPRRLCATSNNRAASSVSSSMTVDNVSVTGNASVFGIVLGKTLTAVGNPDLHHDTSLTGF